MSTPSLTPSLGQSHSHRHHFGRGGCDLQREPSRLRRGFSEFLHRLRHPHRGADATAEATTPAEPGTAEDQATLMAQLLQTRASEAFAQIDDEALLNHRGAWKMQETSLEEMNCNAVARIDRLFAEPQGGQAKQDEAEGLLAEVEHRKRYITILRLSLDLLERELEKRGVPLTVPIIARGVVDVPEDDGDLCQYCVSNPADTEYRCCGHRGACQDCAKLMHHHGARCPHCRTPNAAFRKV